MDTHTDQTQEKMNDAPIIAITCFLSIASKFFSSSKYFKNVRQILNKLTNKF